MNTRRQKHKPISPSAADYLIASRQCELTNLQYFLQMGKVVQSISNLVHGFQRERGAANVFLGSSGKKFVEERQATFKESDRLSGIFQQALAEVHEVLTAHPVSSHLLNHIASALHGLEELPSLRARVEKPGALSGAGNRSLPRLIQEFITVVFDAADTAVDPNIAGLLVAMVHLMNGKEFCGQERAVGSAGFSSGRFDSALSKRMMHLVEAQERCFEVFVSFANDECRELWHTLRTNDRESEIKRLRQLGCSVGRYKSLDPELADHWFMLMSERMDELKKVEDAVEGSFHTRCVERFAEARNSLAHQETLIASLTRRIIHRNRCWCCAILAMMPGRASPGKVRVLANSSVGPFLTWCRSRPGDCSR
ncbi:MAG: nitrate- and nitrite sensing domain-containing protein [Marinobacter sp.]|nr:nitrate- and nitrite sensing domain-containing protein [Marinobacter sp.]